MSERVTARPGEDMMDAIFRALYDAEAAGQPLQKVRLSRDDYCRLRMSQRYHSIMAPSGHAESVFGLPIILTED